ncbi:LacI family DNA-binding transcriptional regulator [Cereibacter sp. SYSU M97828]|nr:LacI family DNA-binding transcriptional regulator [Cereibacter flavus]
MVTIRDVAKHAGVSVGTVSRVVSKNLTVSSKMRAAVEAAILELGYKPNLIARSLRNAKSNIIALIVPDIANPHFSQLALHIETVASRFGLMVVVANTHGDVEVERKQIATLSTLTPTGFLIIPAGSNPTGNQTGNIRTVAVDRPYGDHPLVSADHYAGGRLAAAHLIGLGHRRIAYLSGPEELSVAHNRKEGFLSVFDEARQNGKPDLSVPELIAGGFDYALDAETLTKLLLKPICQRPTAIATSNDQQAIGLMRLARDHGVSVPRDLTVIGFDDVPLASLTIPRLTTIAQPVQAIAERAVITLLDTESTNSSILQPVLKQRETSLTVSGWLV